MCVCVVYSLFYCPECGACYVIVALQGKAGKEERDGKEWGESSQILSYSNLLGAGYISIYGRSDCILVVHTELTSFNSI